MKTLHVSSHGSGIMVRYEDNYGVSAFIVPAADALALGLALQRAATQPADAHTRQTILEDLTTEDTE